MICKIRFFNLNQFSHLKKNQLFFFEDFNKLFQTWNVGNSEVMEYGGPEFLTTKKLKQDVRNMQISSKLNDIAEIIGWDNVDLLPWEENPELKKEMPFFNS